VTLKEAAAELGVSLTSVYRLMENRILPWTKIGGRRRIPRAALGAVARSNFVGDQTILESPPISGRKVSMDSSRATPSMDQTRRGVAERFDRIQHSGDFDLAYAYRRVLADLDANGEKGGVYAT
jgi:excisionase family DNA binding protein